MRLWSNSAGLYLLFAVATSAAPVACVSGSLQSYTNLTQGCLLGDKLVSGFRYSRGAGGVLATNITVTPVDANSLNPGLRFTDSWSVFGNDSILSTLSFSVQVQAGGAQITDASLTALISDTLLGNATTQVNERVCTTSILPCAGMAGIKQMQVTLNKNSPTFEAIASTPASVSFGPTKNIGVVDALDLAANQGNARLTSFTERFSEVPEPASLLLTLSAGAMLGLWNLIRSRSGHFRDRS